MPSPIAAVPEFPWHVFWAMLSFAWGASIGSFLNVCIHRIPRELSVVRPRSFCPQCSHPIAWYHNVPIVSYLLLRGKCRYCGDRIVPRYVVVEALVGVLFLLVWLKFGFTMGPRPLGLAAVTDWRLDPAYWLAVSGLVLGTFVDFEHLIIPDRVTLGGIVAGVVLSGLVPQMHGEHEWVRGLWQSALGAAAGWGLLWAVAVLGTLIFRKDAMGFGDVKLMGAIGAFLGWRAVLFTMMLSSLAGSLVGVGLVLTGRKQMQSRIPYGPYLALAALVWMLWGPALWDLYLRLLTPSLPEF
jgi:leader peptidase (prepilin peptidase) / N-methyltransferase